MESMKAETEQPRTREQSREYPGRRPINKDEELSRSMSWALRHAAPSLGLSIGSDGYVAVVDLLSCKHPRFQAKKYTLRDVQRLVENNDKKRFRLEFRADSSNCSTRLQKGQERNEEGWYIRACQGHSLEHVKTEELLTPIPPEELECMNTIVHGTTKHAWEIIQQKGLSKMNRNHIHFAAGLPGDKTKVISGMRTKREIDIYIDGKKCAQDSIKFYRSENKVILTAGCRDEGVLPMDYIAKVVDVQTGKILHQKHSVTIGSFVPCAANGSLVLIDDNSKIHR